MIDNGRPAVGRSSFQSSPLAPNCQLFHDRQHSRSTPVPALFTRPAALPRPRRPRRCGCRGPTPRRWPRRGRRRSRRARRIRRRRPRAWSACAAACAPDAAGCRAWRCPTACRSPSPIATATSSWPSSPDAFIRCSIPGDHEIATSPAGTARFYQPVTATVRQVRQPTRRVDAVRAAAAARQRGAASVPRARGSADADARRDRLFQRRDRAGRAGAAEVARRRAHLRRRLRRHDVGRPVAVPGIRTRRHRDGRAVLPGDRQSRSRSPRPQRRRLLPHVSRSLRSDLLLLQRRRDPLRGAGRCDVARLGLHRLRRRASVEVAGGRPRAGRARAHGGRLHAHPAALHAAPAAEAVRRRRSTPS